MRSPSSGRKPSVSKASDSVTTSFISRSSSCMPFCTWMSVSADSLKRPSKICPRCTTHDARDTLAMLYSDSHA